MGLAASPRRCLPAFSYVSTSLSDSQVSTTANQVQFTLQAESSFNYTVTASSTPGPYSFSGTLRDSDRQDSAVGGANSVTVTAPDASSASRSFNPGFGFPGRTGGGDDQGI